VSAEITLDEFMVRMGQFADAKDTIGKQRERILESLAAIGQIFTEIAGDWQSPAEETFAALASEFTADAADVTDLLGEAHSRLNLAFENYANAENRNVTNLSDGKA